MRRNTERRHNTMNLLHVNPSTKLMQERQRGQRNDGIAGAIHAALTRFGKLDATTAWGDNDTSSQPLDDWRGVSAARAKWRSGAMTLCRKRLGLRSKEKHDGDSSSKGGDCPLSFVVIKT